MVGIFRSVGGYFQSLVVGKFCQNQIKVQCNNYELCNERIVSFTKTCDPCYVSKIIQHCFQIWQNLRDCFVRCFLYVNGYFGKWFAPKARKLSLKVYDARNTSMYHPVPLGFCSECMLSLNICLWSMSEIIRMSEIRGLYPIFALPIISHHCTVNTMAADGLVTAWWSMHALRTGLL